LLAKLVVDPDLVSPPPSGGEVIPPGPAPAIPFGFGEEKEEK
jgi:hypothetical protein